MTNAQDERAALAALLEETGPDGPTLCEGWQTRDLAAHLVLRERRPDAAVGVMGGPLAPYTARVQQQFLDRYSYQDLVTQFRSGPPRLSPFAITALDEAANAVEYFVHHEDVRRASAGDWTERELSPAMSELLWKRLKSARLLLRSAPAGIVLAREHNGKLDLIIAKTAAPTVTVTGSPAELTLWSMGRTSASHVALDGPPGAVETLSAWRC
ncbi:MAG TPA: TIGR03085 family metal-binding protein [Trebonia sp.]